DLFEASTIERMAVNFECLLAGIVAEPGCRVSHLPLLSDVERQQLLVQWNDTGADFPQDRCLHELFEAQVVRSPNAIAAQFGEERLSYALMNTRSNQLAHYLIEHGLGADQMVGICVERSLEMIIALLGVLKAGGAYVPLDPEQPVQRLRYMIGECGISLLVTSRSTDAKMTKMMASAALQTVCLDAGQPAWHDLPTGNPGTRVPSDSLAYTLFTSGSTGKPKGVMVEHRQVVQYSLSVIERCEFHSPMSYALVQPIMFDISMTMLLGALFTGGTLHVISREMSLDPLAISRYFGQHRIDCLKITPSHLSALMSESVLPAKRLILGGEASHWGLIRSLKLAPECRVINHYGPTETTVGVLSYEINEKKMGSGSHDESSVPIGRPLRGSRAYILDEHRQAVPIGVEGVLYIGGAQVARGYLNLPELTDEMFIPNPLEPTQRLYKTGDRARFLVNGDIEYLGRSDEQLKIRGFRVEPAEIEAVLSESALVRGAVVSGIEDQGGEIQLVAYVILQNTAIGRRAGLDALKAFLVANVADYMLPSAWVFLDEIPRLPNGKVDRRALPRPDVGALQAEQYEAPVTSTDERLAGIWSTLLDVERVGLDDNFFELGGHSLLAIQMLSRIREAFSIEFPLKWLFESPTVGSLAPRIDAQQSEIVSDSEMELVPATRETALMLSHAQERLWFLDQLEGASTLYNMHYALHLRGVLHVEALERALQQIVQRHEVLRTAIILGPDGVPHQQVTQEALVLSRVSVQGGGEQCDASLHRLVSEERERTFDLSDALKIRATLIAVERVGESGSAATGQSTEYLLLITLHHIASDGWSMGVFREELSRLYNDYRSGISASLAPLPIQYADFAAWQRQWLDDALMGQQLEYWRAQLSGVPALLELPTDHPRPAVQRFRGGVHRFALPARLSDQLRALGREQGVTLYMTLLSAFSVLLSRYSGQEDIVVGSPVANRMRVQVESLIGFFVNTLVLRTDLSGEVSFKQLLGRVREMTLQAYQHQDMPFEKLVEALQPGRSMSYSPL
ncbi:MAG: amino acid adenylation domain-containing protein, partial [Granulosicoccus sp.]|nr:amino acid adenylation domain-containing protein [Granulosicoccus sp.]